MGKQAQVAAHLSSDELERRYRAASEATERSWWQILWLLARGQTTRAVAESGGERRLFGVLDQADCYRYNTEGPAEMVNRWRTRAQRAATLLNSTQLETPWPALAESRILAVAGRVERASGHVTLLAEKLRAYTQPGAEPGAEQTDEQADPERRRKDAPGAQLAHG